MTVLRRCKVCFGRWRWVCRWASSNVYSDTLLLPRTAFPQRPDHASSHRLAEVNGQRLYDWQRQRLDRKPFILHDGPPYANGSIHIGHAMNKVLKDIIVRSKILTGHRVTYTPGWDCHGLPIEVKALQRASIDHAGDNSPMRIRAVAKQLAAETIELQSRQFQSLALCGNWAKPYATFDTSFELAQLRIFADMVEKGMVYRAAKPVYWSPSSRTALAEAELEYNDQHISHSAYFGLQLTTKSAMRFSGSVDTVLMAAEAPPIYLLVWTTTPWTIPANRAVAVNVEISYTLVRADGKTYLIAENLVDSLKQHFKDLHPTRLRLSGAELAGLTYLDPFSDTIEDAEERPVLAADYVSDESGTGLVHIAPGHGQEDYVLCKALSQPILPFSPVDHAGRYTVEVSIPSLVGLDVQTEGSKAVIELMRGRGLLVAVQRYKHKYPYDWRTKQPIIVRSTPQWFSSLAAIKPQALEVLEGVEMIPKSGHARLHTYVQNRNEWCISRQRSWGVPIPAFYDEHGETHMTSESITHVATVIREHGTDAWFSSDPAVDEMWLPPNLRGDGKAWQRGTETLDVWFDSGCSWNTLTEDGAHTQADLVIEGTDQHRGWFQSSLLTSVATRGIPPYKSVLTHGFTLDDKGHKMSKSLGNVIDPLLVIYGRPATEPRPVDRESTPRKHWRRLEELARSEGEAVKPLGVDVLRLWVAQSDYGQDVAVSSTILQHVAEAMRKIRLTVRFLVSNLADYDDQSACDLLPLDRYAMRQSATFRMQAFEHYDSFAFNKVVSLLNHHTNVYLSAFYLDIVKDRLYADAANSSSRRAAQAALAEIAKDYLTVLAPIAPLLVTEAWEHLPEKFTQGAKHIFEADWQLSQGHRETLDQPGEDEHWARLLDLRQHVNAALEQARRSKLIRGSLEADVCLNSSIVMSGDASIAADTAVVDALLDRSQLADFLLVSAVHHAVPNGAIVLGRISCDGAEYTIIKAMGVKCPRCWRLQAQKGDSMCSRCRAVLSQHR